MNLFYIKYKLKTKITSWDEKGKHSKSLQRSGEYVC